MSSQDEFFGGKGYPAIKFETTGVWYKGTVVKAEIVPRPSLNDPTVIEDNAVVTLDPTGNGNEDEYRSLWMRRSQLSGAVRDAYLSVGAPRLEVGGILAVRWVSTDAPKQPGHNGRKVYEAQYKVPPDAPAPVAAESAEDPFAGL